MDLRCDLVALDHDIDAAEQALTLHSLVSRAERTGESLSIRVAGAHTVMTFGRGRGRRRVRVCGVHEDFYRLAARLAAGLIAEDYD